MYNKGHEMVKHIYSLTTELPNNFVRKRERESERGNNIPFCFFELSMSPTNLKKSRYQSFVSLSNIFALVHGENHQKTKNVCKYTIYVVNYSLLT